MACACEHINNRRLNYAPADFDLSPYFAIVKPTLDDRAGVLGAIELARLSTTGDDDPSR